MSSMRISPLPDLTAENVTTGGIDTLIDAVCSRLGFNKKVKWSWKVMNRRFGKAFLSSQRIELNPIVLSLSDAYEHLKDTVIHEVCHVIAFAHFRDKGHGRGWKTAMRVCGLSPRRQTSLSGPDFDRMNHGAHRRFKYNCDSCGRLFIVSAARHTKILKGKTYLTSCCRSTISFFSDREAENG